MPLPSQVHNDTFLTNLLAGLPNDGFIADEVLPPLRSAKETGKIAKMDESHFRLDFASRAPGTAGHQIDWSPTSVSFEAEEFRLIHKVDDRIRDQYDSPFDAYRDAAYLLRNRIMRKKEDLVATLVTTAGNYASGNTDTNNKDWDTPGTGTPVTDVQGAIATIIGKTGVSEANMHGCCSYQVFKWLRANTEVKAFYTSTTPGAAAPSSMTASQVAQALGLASLHVGSAVKNTALEGATASKSYIWGADDFAVFYRSPLQSIMEPNFGWQVYSSTAGGAGAILVDRYREEATTSEVIRCRTVLDEIVTENQLGFLFTSVDGS